MPRRRANKLELDWEETQPGEELGRRWGQLAGAMHRLSFAIEELHAVAEASEVENVVRRLEYHLENYFYRSYELRERASGLITTIHPSQAAVVGRLKNPTKRAAALALLERTAPGLGRIMESLLEATDEAVQIRNLHTHDTFLRLGLLTDHGLYDPVDALTVDAPGRPELRRQLETDLRKEAGRIGREYEKKARKVVEITMTLLMATEKLTIQAR
jgi:hypothetical protein